MLKISVPQLENNYETTAAARTLPFVICSFRAIISTYCLSEKTEQNGAGKISSVGKHKWNKIHNSGTKVIQIVIADSFALNKLNAHFVSFITDMRPEILYSCFNGMLTTGYDPALKKYRCVIHLAEYSSNLY